MEDQDYLLFDQYLLGDCSAEELVAFELRLKSDSVFEKEFRLYKDLHAHLQHKIENEIETHTFKENLKSISNNYFNPSEERIEIETRSKPITVTILKYAVAACVVLLVGIFAFNNFGDPTYSDYNTHEPMTVVRGESGVKDLAEATNAFNTKDYERANEVLKKVLESDSKNMELQLYLAITFLELDDFNAADALLFNLSQSNSAYKYKAIWYAALSQLKQKNNTKSIALLKQIPKTADDYKQAKKLLDKLE